MDEIQKKNCDYLEVEIETRETELNGQILCL